ncbi:MAG TPA: MFS transporter [Holophagaceae bacterium]|nr:MFS transporter [Holophagaceae bacterium]
MRRLQPKTAALLVTALAFHVDMLLYYLLVPLLPRYARELHLSQMQVSVLFGSYAVALLAATFPVARFTDRHGRRAPMLWGLTGLAATTLIFAFAKAYWLLLLARTLQGVAGAFTWLPGMALLADHYPSEQRGKAMATAFAAANLGVLLGPALSGFLDHAVGPFAPFAVGIGLVVLDAAGRAFLLPDVEAVREEAIPLGTLLRNPVVRLFAGAMVLGSALWALLESTLPLDMDARLKAGAPAIGLCFSGVALAHTATSPFMGALSDRIGRVKVLRIGLPLVAVLLPLPAILPSIWTVGLAMGALGVCASFIMSPCSPAIADQIDGMGSKAFASGFAVLNISYSAGMIVGPYLGGTLVTAFKLPVALTVCGLGYGAYLLATRGVKA